MINKLQSIVIKKAARKKNEHHLNQYNPNGPKLLIIYKNHFRLEYKSKMLLIFLIHTNLLYYNYYEFYFY